MKHMSICATCIYWQGEREDAGNSVRVSSSSALGKCGNMMSPQKGATKRADQYCNKQETVW